MDIYGYSMKAVVVSLVALFLVTFIIGVASLLEPNFATYTNSQGEAVELPAQDTTNPTLVRVALAANTVLSAITLTYIGAGVAFELRGYMRQYPKSATISLYNVVVSNKVFVAVMFYGIVLLTAALFYLSDGGWSTNPGTILAPLPALFDTTVTIVLSLLGAKGGTKLITLLKSPAP